MIKSVRLSPKQSYSAFHILHAHHFDPTYHEYLYHQWLSWHQDLVYDTMRTKRREARLAGSYLRGRVVRGAKARREKRWRRPKSAGGKLEWEREREREREGWMDEDVDVDEWAIPVCVLRLRSLFVLGRLVFVRLRLFLGGASGGRITITLLPLIFLLFSYPASCVPPSRTSRPPNCTV